MGEFDKTLGPLIIAIFLNLYLYGFMMFQLGSYQSTKFNDPFWIRALVVFLFSVDTFHTVSTIYLAWKYCVENFINPEIFGAGQWAYAFTPIGVAFTGLVAHLFLAHRFFRLTGNGIAYGINIVITSLVFGLAIAAGIWGIIKSMSMERIISTLPIFRGLAISWLSIQTGLDAFLAASLGYSLWFCKPPFMATESIKNRILRGAIQCGLSGCIFSLASLLAFLVYPHTTLYGVFAIPLGRVYSITILDTLLSRKVDATSGMKITKRLTQDLWIPSAPTQPAPTNSFSLHSIHVKTEVFTDAGRATPLSRMPSNGEKMVSV